MDTAENRTDWQAGVDFLRDDSDDDSLFDEDDGDHEDVAATGSKPEVPEDGQTGSAIASRTAPPIPGLYFDPTILIAHDIVDSLWNEATRTFFTNPNVNQIMLFERSVDAEADSDNIRLPAFLLDLITVLSEMLKPLLPDEIHELLFYPNATRRARQAILNFYRPGEGISPHVDLINRFGDGIIGVSLHSGCVMQFGRVEMDDRVPSVYDLYLPPRSVIILTGEARFKWSHAIEKRTYDSVRRGSDDEVENLERGTRLSITFRWLLPGAEIVGGD